MRSASTRGKQLRHQKLLVYTDNSIGDDGSLTVFASAYRTNAETPNAMPLRETELLPITTKDEWEFLEAALDSAIG